MDPYKILGISRSASQDEIKKAYRREAMKWHPDRSSNSAEARERFHQAAEAYKMLSEKLAADGTDRGSSSTRQQEQGAGQDRYSDSRYRDSSSGDEFADTVFWDVMLDFAIRLAQRGKSEIEISRRLGENGCTHRLAGVIAEKAYNINAHFAANRGAGKPGDDDAGSFKQDRLESELQRAFLGDDRLAQSAGGKVEYYLVVFNELKQADKRNPLALINGNRRLLRILSFSIMLFAALALAIHFYPAASDYKLLPDLNLLQIPLGLLSLMFIWSLYRKLWLFTAVFWVIYLATLVIFNSFVPQALNQNPASILPYVLLCYAPFVFIALYANYFYFRKSQQLIGLANRLFDEHFDKLLWIKNRGGTSSTAFFFSILVLAASLVYLAPEQDDLAEVVNFSLPPLEFELEDSAAEKARERLARASRSFILAESLFHAKPPDYAKAAKAYGNAADDGSLLAAYMLGYMYYNGEGVEQNDFQALEFFEQATRAPLAFQPHSLKLTTEYLAESYNNLGIMYRHGYGARQNLQRAREMFKRATKFGSPAARQNLKASYSRLSDHPRQPLPSPQF